MVLVCMSHIKHHFESTSPELHWMLMTISRVATPTFLLLSGFVIGHLLRTDQRGSVPLALVDRALFLLIVAHVLLGLAELPELGFVPWLFGRVAITDAIGVALFAAILLRAVSMSTLIAVGVSLCVLSWIIATALPLEPEWARALGSLLFDMRSDISSRIDAPLVPYLGVFLLGMALSLHLAPALDAGGSSGFITRRLASLGSIALIAVVGGIAAWEAAKILLPEATVHSGIGTALRETLDPRRKHPPSPSYLLFNGGIALLLLGAFFYGRPARLLLPLRQHASVIGRASLMCFVVQDWLFFVLPAVFGYDQLTSPLFWFTYLALGVLALYWLARAWDRAGGNRFLTVGLKRMLREPVLQGAASHRRPHDLNR